MGINQLEGHLDVESATILENPEKGIKYVFVVTEFRGENYIGVREYYQDFEGEWMPTRNGFTMPYTLDSTFKLYRAFRGLLSKCEVLTEVEESCKVEA